MKKVISTILAMAMVLSMTAAFATIDPVDFAGFDVESTCIYDNDFDAEPAAPFSGLDLDVEAKPTKWEYVERATGDMAVKVWHETVPTYDEVLETLPTKPENEEEIEEGVTYKEDYTEAMYKAWYKEHGYVAITGDKGAITSGTDAYVLDFDIYFPVIPEHGASVNIWNGMKQNGVRAVKPFLFSYVDTVNEDNEVVEEGDVFGFISGQELITEIEAETWYDCTQVVDIAERYIHYYINGELVNTVDIAAAGPITDRGYVRAVYAPFGLEEGFYLDNVHIYEANAEVIKPEWYVSRNSNPLDFEGNVITSNTLKKDGNNVTTLNNAGVSAYGYDQDCIDITDDPETDGTHGDVLKIINSTANQDKLISTSPGFSDNFVNKPDEYRYNLEFDYYIDTTNRTNTSSSTSYIAYVAFYPDNETERAKREFKVFGQAVTDASGNTVIGNGGGSVAIENNTWVHVSVSWNSNGYVTLYVDDTLVCEDVKLITGTSMTQLDYIRSMSTGADNGISHYYDNWHLYETTTIPVALTTTDYTAGTSAVGDSVTLTATSYVTGQTATIEMSTDGVNWAAFTGTAATLTASTVYYRAKAGDYVTEPILLYGVAGPVLVQRAEILNVDFETKNGISYGIAENETGFDNLITIDGETETETIVRSAENGIFNVETKAATVDAAGVATDNYRTTEVANAPAGYANAANIGATALKITGNGEKTAGAISQIYINLCGSGNTYPGGADSDNSGVQDGDIYVTEFDYAYDAAVDEEIQIVSYRAKWNATGTSYYAIAMSADGTLKCANKETSTVLAPKTWYNIKVAAHYATGTVDVYVNDILVNTQTSSTGSLGMWESFRLWGDRAAAAVSDVVYYDNMNFYIAQTPDAPTASDVKLGTIAYANGAETVDQMGDYDDLMVTATLTNNGVADGVVAVFALYDSNDILKNLAVEPVAFGADETSRTVTGELDASDATDTVKVFLWDNVGNVAPKGEITANNANL